MTYNYATLFSELKTRVRTAWPEVLPVNGGGGIHEIDRVNRLTIEAKSFPYCVLDMEPGAEGDWGLIYVTPQPVLNLHYVTRESVGMATLRSKLEALRDEIMKPSSSYTGAVPLEVVHLDWSPAQEGMAIFYAKNAPLESGTLGIRFVVGASAS